MKLSDLIRWLENKPKFKPKEDLNKMKLALNLINNPQNDYKTIHITGTNGKGSTAKYISSIIGEVNKVGLFTSPYVVKFNERIQINNNPISDHDLYEYILWSKQFDEEFLDKYKENFSFFELLTIITYKYFSDQKVDYAIIEVGIGGRLDSTNVINSNLSVITSLSLDHTQQLGNTKEKILLEKLGIVKKNSYLITGLTEYRKIIDQHVKTVGSKVKYVDLNDYKLIKTIPLEIMYKNNIYTSNLLGLYQINNLITALESINVLLPNLSIKTIKNGVKNACNPGRFEMVKSEPIVILDGAHNLGAMTKLIKSVNKMFKGKKIYILYTSMSDKPYYQMLKMLTKLTKSIYLTTLPLPRVFNDFKKLREKYIVIENAVTAFNEILSKAAKDEVIIVTGSMYLVSEIRKQLIRENYV